MVNPAIMKVGLPAVDARMLGLLEKAFEAHAGADAVIDAEELQKALGMQSGYLARRVLALLDLDHDGVVRRDEFLEGVRKLLFGTPREKLAFAFKLHDHNGDGTLEREELRRMIAIGLAEDDVAMRPEQVDRIVHLLFAHADRNRDERLSFQEFSAAVQSFPGLLEQMTRSEARWMLPNEELLEALFAPRPSRRERWLRALQNRRLPAVVLALWALGNIVAFLAGALAVRGAGSARSELFWMLSKGCTHALQFNAGLLLWPVLRRTVGWARGTFLGRVLPVDHAQAFHRYVGTALFGFSTGHVFAAVADYAASGSVWQRLASGRGLTGLGCFAVFAFLWSFSRESVRRSGRFELFYFSHLLYVVWFVLALWHAPPLWLVLGAPLLGLGVELGARQLRRGHRVRLLSFEALRSGVTRLEFERPQGFRARAGDWAFLCLPAVAGHEWHPFTLSSAPERDTLTVHVRSLGNWTAALRRLFERAEASEASTLEAYLDGPYGSPTSRLFEAKVPVLLGAGIGVTPFASVLESLHVQHQEGRAPAKLERAYFYWLSRDHFSFEWFRALLARLERQEAPRRLELRLFLTGGQAGASALGLELGRELLHASGELDPLSQLQSKVHRGHPDWEQELQGLLAAHPSGGVEVFFCGPPGLGRKVRRACDKLAIPFHEERF